MRFPQGYVLKAQQPSGTLSLTGASAAAAAPALDTGAASLCLGARCFVQATTSSLDIFAKWQVLDDDGSTWIDVIDQTNAAPTYIVQGSGSAVTKKFYLNAPICITAGSRQARVYFYSSGASGAGGTTDYATAEYDYRAPVNAYGT